MTLRMRKTSRRPKGLLSGEEFGPINALDRVPTALWTDLMLKREPRTTVMTRVGFRLLLLLKESITNPLYNTHCLPSITR